MRGAGPSRLQTLFGAASGRTPAPLARLLGFVRVLSDQPTLKWEADVGLPDASAFGGYGSSREDALRNALEAAASKGALGSVDWAVVVPFVVRTALRDSFK